MGSGPRRDAISPPEVGGRRARLGAQPHPKEGRRWGRYTSSPLPPPPPGSLPRRGDSENPALLRQRQAGACAPLGEQCAPLRVLRVPCPRADTRGVALGFGARAVGVVARARSLANGAWRRVGCGKARAPQPRPGVQTCAPPCPAGRPQPGEARVQGPRSCVLRGRGARRGSGPGRGAHR